MTERVVSPGDGARAVRSGRSNRLDRPQRIPPEDRAAHDPTTRARDGYSNERRSMRRIRRNEPRLVLFHVGRPYHWAQSLSRARLPRPIERGSFGFRLYGYGPSGGFSRWPECRPGLTQLIESAQAARRRLARRAREPHVVHGSTAGRPCMSCTVDVPCPSVLRAIDIDRIAGVGFTGLPFAGRPRAI